MLQEFYSVCDHFTTLPSKGLKGKNGYLDLPLTSHKTAGRLTCLSHLYEKEVVRKHNDSRHS